MNAVNMVAIVLIIGGILGLAYGSFNYTRETQQAKIGPIELSVKESRTVQIPVWASIGAIVLGAGGGLLLSMNKKSSH
jgi:uncharacterized membrane protein